MISSRHENNKQKPWITNGILNAIKQKNTFLQNLLKSSVGAGERKKSAYFVTFILSEGNFFNILCFISMYSVLKKLSEYIYFYILKNSN